MRAGRMDQRITLQRCTETADGAGGVTRAWANLLRDPSPWASVSAKAGGENLNEGRVNAAYTVAFTIYNRSDLSEKDRIVWQGENYNIRSVSRLGDRQQYLTIIAERGVSE